MSVAKAVSLAVCSWMLLAALVRADTIPSKGGSWNVWANGGRAVTADDSGLGVDALGGAPGVRSARYAADKNDENSSDAANNARLLREVAHVPNAQRQAQFVCVIAAARDGSTLATFRGETEGVILHTLRGSGGFGYDPLFYFAELGKTFAELSAEEKAKVSHRGKAFRTFLQWYEQQAE